MIHPFLRRIAAGPLLADGAMGTMLYSRGISFERCFEELNVAEPGVVQQIHREYLAAGAELIETNTFGGNRYRLALHGCEGRVRELNLRGVKLAREAREIAGEPAFVAGSVGPIGRALSPLGDVTLHAARDAFREQIDALLEGGADLIILETFPRLDELLAALSAARAAGDLPIVAQVTIDEDGRTLDGQEMDEVARALEAAGASVVGVNCGVGPQGTLAAVEALSAATALPISAMPNAGLPQRFGGRFVYFTTPSYFGDYAGRLVAAGAKLVGGCCGTTPAHVAAMRAALRESLPTAAAAAPARVEVVAPEAPEKVAAAPTHLARLFAERKFVVSVELDPPRGVNPGKMIAGAKALKEAGADVFNVADSPMARVRMSCLASARLTMEATGLETIIHFTTRDRNLMALQSELIGAHATGIRNVLALTGDPPRLGDYPSATGVWDVDSIGLIKILKGLNQGKDWAGTSIGRLGVLLRRRGGQSDRRRHRDRARPLPPEARCRGRLRDVPAPLRHGHASSLPRPRRARPARAAPPRDHARPELSARRVSPQRGPGHHAPGGASRADAARRGARHRRGACPGSGVPAPSDGRGAGPDRGHLPDALVRSV